MIPGVQLDLALQRNVEAQDSVSGAFGQQHGARLYFVARSARAIHGKPASLPLRSHRAISANALSPPRELDPRASPYPSFLRTPSETFALKILTGHDDDAPAPPIVSAGKSAAVPANQYGALALSVNPLQMLISFSFPTQCSSDCS